MKMEATTSESLEPSDIEQPTSQLMDIINTTKQKYPDQTKAQAQAYHITKYKLRVQLT